MKKLFATIILPLVFSLNCCFVFAKNVIPGGESIGIVLPYHGVLVTGNYAFFVDGEQINPNKEKFYAGDLIRKVDGQTVETNDDLISYIHSTFPSKTSVELEIERDGKILKNELKIYYNDKDDSFTTGIYIKDHLSGIGTITYYDPQNRTYGALGHPMVDTDSELSISVGDAFDAYILSVEKGQNGSPGQKIARIEKTKRIGDVAINNQFGVYGHYNNDLSFHHASMETATQDEIKLGPAKIYTVLNEHEVVTYDIEITELEKQNRQMIKGITFKVTDEDLLSLTNGVIQGMSGSPIIQNGKLIGAVTHVNVDDVRYGYGLYIEWMLEENSKMIG